MAAEKLPDKSCKYPPAKRPRNTGDGITQKHIGINKPKIGYPKYGGAMATPCNNKAIKTLRLALQ